MKTGRIDNMNRRAFVGLGALTALGALAGCLGGATLRDDELTDTVERSFDVGDVRSLGVSNAVGSVLVTTTDDAADTVAVEIRRRSWNGRRGIDAIRADATLDAGALTVETAIDGDETFTRRPPISDVTITVPRGTDTPVVTDVTTTFGDVTLLGTRGDTAVQTDAGAVVASGVDGYLSLRSDVGSVEASDVTGIDSVTTNAGRIKVDLRSVRGDVDIGTDLGNVAVGVADDLDLDVFAETRGELSSDLSLVDARRDGSRFVGRLNAGGHRLRVSSSLGGVSLRRL